MFGAFVMALLGIMGFVLIGRWMLGSVNWVMLQHARGHPI